MAGLASLATKIGSFVSERKTNASLIELTPEGLFKSACAFQYFPESFSDSKAVSWQAKEIPGASLPLYQWTSSGERSVSFTAQFTTDIDPFAQGDVPDVSEFNSRLQSNGVLRRNIDVRSAVIWLRRYMFPTYSAGVTVPPPRLILYLPLSGLGLAGGETNLSTADQMLCVMTQCEITWEKFFPSGNARSASVSLAFAQVPQSGGSVALPSAGANMASAVSAGRVDGVAFLGYEVDKKATFAQFALR